MDKDEAKSLVEEAEAATERIDALKEEAEKSTAEALQRKWAAETGGPPIAARAVAARADFGSENYPEAAEKAREALELFRALEPKATAPEKDTRAETLANVRAVAKEWLAGVTALVGLFSISSVFFAKDALADLSGGEAALVGIAACMAAVAAALAIGAGTRAAHGLPKVPRQGFRPFTPSTAALEFEGTEKQIKKTVLYLRGAIILAGTSLALLLTALGILWVASA